MKGLPLQEGDGGRVALDLLRAGASVRLVAGGHSMTPTVRDRDRLTLEPLGSPPRIGDVLACEVDSRLVVHRLVGRKAGRLEVRGDVAPASDPPLPPGAAVGRVTRVERGSRRVRLGLGPERLLLAGLARLGLLRAAARWCGSLRGVSLGSGIRVALPVHEGTGRGVSP